MTESKKPFWKKLALYSPFQGTGGIAKFIVIPSLICFLDGAFLFYGTGSWKGVWLSFGIQCVFLFLFVWYDERQARKQEDLKTQNMRLMEEQRYERLREMIALEIRNAELLHQVTSLISCLEKERGPLMGDAAETPPKEEEPVS